MASEGQLLLNFIGLWASSNHSSEGKGRFGIYGFTVKNPGQKPRKSQMPCGVTRMASFLAL